ncbi:MAG: CotH kinase family protein [Thermotogota bacterium]|nr:CotH kinase family protein [Thermotogota bacterium]
MRLNSLLMILVGVLLFSGCQTEMMEQSTQRIDIYNDEKALEINLIMDPQLYQQMMSEKHTGEILVNPDAPLPDNPYNWYPADVEINGIRINHVGMRNRGFMGSLYSSDPRFKLQLDRYIPGQNFFGIKDITVSNSAGDVIRFRTHLIYDLYEAAGYPAPRSTVAYVSLNGQFLGVSVNVEPIKKPFLMRCFGNDEGSLYEGEKYADFLLDRLNRFESKTSHTDRTKDPIKQLARVLEMPDDQLVDELSQVLDIERYLTFLAVNYIGNNSDSYNDAQNNFYLYFDPDDGNKATLIPWGADKGFGDYNSPFSNHLQAEIPRRISRIPQLNKKMEQELLRVVNEVWNEEEIIKKIDRYSELVQTSGVSIDHFNQQVEALKAWVIQRNDQVREVVSLGVGEGADPSTTYMQMVEVKTQQAKEKYSGDKTFDKEFTAQEKEDWNKTTGESKEKSWDKTGDKSWNSKKAPLESPVDQQSKETLKDTTSGNPKNNRGMYYLGIIFLAALMIGFIKFIR